MGKAIAAIILAAGYSSRMGEYKPLLKIGDNTIVERCIVMFREAQIGDVRVVVGHEKELLDPVLRDAGARAIFNEHYERGMFSSVLAGLESIGPGISAAFVMPVDIPMVTSETVRRMLGEHKEKPDKILVPCLNGRRGHPVLIPAKYFASIRSWQGDEGLRGALRALAGEIAEVPVDDPGILLDLDTPEDYRRMAGSAK